ncbi:MAG: hypothetical protein ACYCV4_05460 [Dermatophilaceae bacterium]
MELIWEDPPESRSNRTVLTDLADALKQCPGKWACVKENGWFSDVSRIKRKLGKDFEVTGRVIPGQDRTAARVYARYVGHDPDLV